MDRKPGGFLKISFLIDLAFFLLVCGPASGNDRCLPHGLGLPRWFSLAKCCGWVFLPGTGWRRAQGRWEPTGGQPSTVYLTSTRASPSPLGRFLIWTLLTVYISTSVFELGFHKARPALYVFALSNITSSIYTVCFCSPWCNMTKFQPCASHMQVRVQLGCVAWLR